mgnify:FL=1
MTRNNVIKPANTNTPKSLMEWLNLFATYLQELKGTNSYDEPPATTIKNLAEASEVVRAQMIPKYISVKETKESPILLNGTIRSELNEFSIRGKMLGAYYSSGTITKTVDLTDGTHIFESGPLPTKFFIPNKEYKIVVFKNHNITRQGSNALLGIDIYFNNEFYQEIKFNLSKPEEVVVIPFTTSLDLEKVKVMLVGRDIAADINAHIVIYDSDYKDEEIIHDKVPSGITCQNDIKIDTRSVTEINDVSTRMISLPNPICSLSKDIYDVLYYRNNKTLSNRKVAHFLLNGKERWKVMSTDEKTILFGCKDYDDKIADDVKMRVVSNNFVYCADGAERDDRCIYQETQNYKIRIRMPKIELPFQNESGIKEWLKVYNTDIYVKSKSITVNTEPSVGKLNFEVFDGDTNIYCEAPLITEISASAPANTGAFLLTILNNINKMINVSGDTITGDHKFLGAGSIFVNKAETPLMGTNVGKTYVLSSRMSSNGIYTMEYKELDSDQLLASIEMSPDNFKINSEKGYITLRTKGNELIFDGEKGIYSVKKLSLGDAHNQFSEVYVNGTVMYGARLERPVVPSGMIGYLFDLTIHKPIWFNGTNWIDGLGNNV